MTGEELDCFLLHGEGEQERLYRGFLQLPSPADAGHLRLVEDLHDLDDSQRTLPPLRVLLKEGNKVTRACLLDCFVRNRTMSMPTPAAFPLSFYVGQAIVGSDESDREYDNVTVQTDGLMGFFRNLDLTLDTLAPGPPPRVERGSVAFGPWELGIGEALDIETPTRTTANVVWRAEINLRGGPMSFEGWREPFMAALAFFAFCADQPLVPQRTLAYTDEDPVDFHARWQEADAPTRTHPLLRLDQPDEPFARAVEGWHRLWVGAEELVNHVTQFQLRRSRFTLDEATVTAIRGLELYHAYADRFEGAVRDRTEHEGIVAQVMENLPEGVRVHEEWIKDALSEARRKRLRARLEELIADLGSEISDASGIPTNPDELASFVGDAVATRNHWAHRTAETALRVPQGRALLVLCHRLWFLLRACVLLELGFDRPEVAKLLRASGQRHYLLNE